MQTIYKYTLEFADDQTIELTENYQILNVAEQHGMLNLWSIVDTEGPKVPVKIRIFGTGHGFREAKNEFLIHLGTVVMTAGFVWHIFQVEEYAVGDY